MLYVPKILCKIQTASEYKMYSASWDWSAPELHLFYSYESNSTFCLEKKIATSPNCVKKPIFPSKDLICKHLLHLRGEKICYKYSNHISNDAEKM